MSVGATGKEMHGGRCVASQDALSLEQTHLSLNISFKRNMSLAYPDTPQTPSRPGKCSVITSVAQSTWPLRTMIHE